MPQLVANTLGYFRGVTMLTLLATGNNSKSLCTHWVGVQLLHFHPWDTRAICECLICFVLWSFCLVNYNCVTGKAKCFISVESVHVKVIMYYVAFFLTQPASFFPDGGQRRHGGAPHQRPGQAPADEEAELPELPSSVQLPRQHHGAGDRPGHGPQAPQRRRLHRHHRGIFGHVSINFLAPISLFRSFYDWWPKWPSCTS